MIGSLYMKGVYIKHGSHNNHRPFRSSYIRFFVPLPGDYIDDWPSYRDTIKFSICNILRTETLS